MERFRHSNGIISCRLRWSLPDSELIVVYSRQDSLLLGLLSQRAVHTRERRCLEVEEGVFENLRGN